MLNKEDIKKIEKKALQQRKANDLGVESPIGSKVFDIVENQYDSLLLLYPLKSKNIAGFTRKQGNITHVFVNTNFHRAFQNFACAHELYHLIEFQEKQIDEFVVCNNRDISETMEQTDIDINELKANYFAASFLLPRYVVEERFKKVKENKYLEEDFILEIIKLQYQYEVPFKTILKRTKELEIINKKEYDLLKTYESKISEYCKMMDKYIFDAIENLESPSLRKYHTLNVSKMAADVYKHSIISFSKLEYILGKYDKATENFNIDKPEITSVDIDFSGFGTGDDDDEED